MAPATLTLGVSASSPGIKSQGTVLIWRPDGGTLGELEGAETPSGLEARELGKPEEKRRRFQIKVAEGTQSGLHVVPLRFQECPEPAVIRVVVTPSLP